MVNIMDKTKELIKLSVKLDRSITIRKILSNMGINIHMNDVIGLTPTTDGQHVLKCVDIRCGDNHINIKFSKMSQELIEIILEDFKGIKLPYSLKRVNNF